MAESTKVCRKEGNEKKKKCVGSASRCAADHRCDGDVGGVARAHATTGAVLCTKNCQKKNCVCCVIKKAKTVGACVVDTVHVPTPRTDNKNTVALRNIIKQTHNIKDKKLQARRGARSSALSVGFHWIGCSRARGSVVMPVARRARTTHGGRPRSVAFDASAARAAVAAMRQDGTGVAVGEGRVAVERTCSQRISATPPHNGALTNCKNSLRSRPESNSCQTRSSRAGTAAGS